MGYGKWTRWGRGSCEGYSLQIGDALRGQISRGADGRWAASLTNTDLGRHATKEEVRAAVETRIGIGIGIEIEIEIEMTKILEDWAIWQGSAKDRSRARS